MLKGVRAKFEQNADLMGLLKSTSGCELREKALWDGYWGTGRNGKGLNKMGKILEFIRDMLEVVRGRGGGSGQGK
jgi:predicted NAD-dependent protein-ADP-ribosyltransferase YbiA (DUF1768 family)